MKLEKRYWHLFIAIVTGAGLVLNIWFDLKYMNQYYLNMNVPNLDHGYNIAFWFSFLTHFTNIGVFIWYSTSFALSFFNKEFNIFNSLYIRGLVTTMIIFVGVVIFIPFLFIIYRDISYMAGTENEFFGPNIGISKPLFYFLDLLSNLFVHFLVPLLVLIEVLKNGYKKTKNDKYFLPFASLVFLMYFVYVCILLATGTIWGGPYPFIDFFNRSLPWEIVVSLIIDLGALIVYNLIAFLTIKWASKRLS